MATGQDRDISNEEYFSRLERVSSLDNVFGDAYARTVLGDDFVRQVGENPASLRGLDDLTADRIGMIALREDWGQGKTTFSGAFKGAGLGAASGATAGGAIGNVPGAIIGGAIGTVAGFFSGLFGSARDNDARLAQFRREGISSWEAAEDAAVETGRATSAGAAQARQRATGSLAGGQFFGSRSFGRGTQSAAIVTGNLTSWGRQMRTRIADSQRQYTRHMENYFRSLDSAAQVRKGDGVSERQRRKEEWGDNG